MTFHLFTLAGLIVPHPNLTTCVEVDIIVKEVASRQDTGAEEL
jgi:hypothetical protein